MSIINCPNCGRKTNTAICQGWADADPRKARCFARLDTSAEPARYEKGCGYEEADTFDRRFADDLIQGSEISIRSVS